MSPGNQERWSRGLLTNRHQDAFIAESYFCLLFFCLYLLPVNNVIIFLLCLLYSSFRCVYFSFFPHLFSVRRFIYLQAYLFFRFFLLFSLILFLRTVFSFLNVYSAFVHFCRFTSGTPAVHSALTHVSPLLRTLWRSLTHSARVSYYYNTCTHNRSVAEVQVFDVVLYVVTIWGHKSNGLLSFNWWLWLSFLK